MYNEFNPVFLEGLSYVLLLFVDVYIKYVKREVGLVTSFGMPHGILFIPFVFLAFSVRSKVNWNFATKMLVSLAPPFFLSPFYFDRKHFYSKQYATSLRMPYVSQLHTFPLLYLYILDRNKSNKLSRPWFHID